MRETILLLQRHFRMRLEIHKLIWMRGGRRRGRRKMKLNYRYWEVLHRFPRCRKARTEDQPDPGFDNTVRAYEEDR